MRLSMSLLRRHDTKLMDYSSDGIAAFHLSKSNYMRKHRNYQEHFSTIFYYHLSLCLAFLNPYLICRKLEKKTKQAGIVL